MVLLWDWISAGGPREGRNLLGGREVGGADQVALRFRRGSPDPEEPPVPREAIHSPSPRPGYQPRASQFVVRVVVAPPESGETSARQDGVAVGSEEDSSSAESAPFADAWVGL